MLDFFFCEDITHAKKLPWDIGKGFLGTYTVIRTTDRRSCSEASLNGIIKAMQNLDI